MSNFICSDCGTDIIDSPKGYITGCKHWPIDGWKEGAMSTGKKTIEQVMTATKPHQPIRSIKP